MSGIARQALRAAALILAALLLRHAAGAEPVSVRDPWVRATVPGQTVAGVYMDLTSAQAASLIGADSPVAGKTELHTMTLDGGVMKMRPVAGIELPAGRTVNLKPGGLHVMLTGLKRELKAGERVPLKLKVKDAKGAESTLDVDATVRSATGHAAHQ